MIIVKPVIKPTFKFRKLLGGVFLPTEAFLPNGTIEAFDESLLILAVRASNAMLAGVLRNMIGKVSFKLRTIVSLDNLTRAEVSHQLFKRISPILSRQRGPQSNLSLTSPQAYRWLCKHTHSQSL